MSTHVPPGFHTVTPYLIVENAREFLAFAETAFAARILRMDPDGADLVRHAEISVEGSRIELSDAVPDQWEPTRVALHLFVPDADTAHARAVDAGARSLRAPSSHPHGERSGTVTDRWGNLWFLATLEDLDARSD